MFSSLSDADVHRESIEPQGTGAGGIANLCPTGTPLAQAEAVHTPAPVSVVDPTTTAKAPRRSSGKFFLPAVAQARVIPEEVLRARTSQGRQKKVTVVTPPRSHSSPQHGGLEEWPIPEAEFTPPRPPPGYPYIPSPPPREGRARAKAPGAAAPKVPPWLQPPRTRRVPTATIPEDAILTRLGYRPQTRMQKLLAKHYMGNLCTFAQLPEETIADMDDAVEERMTGARSVSRWNSLTGCWKQFLAWLPAIENEDDPLSTAWAIVNFVEAKLAMPPKKEGEKKPFNNSSAIEMLQNLAQVASQLGLYLEPEVISEFKAAVKRAGSGPLHQAPPASMEDVQGTKSYCTEDEWRGIWLARRTCSRIGEIAHLRGEHFQVGPEMDGKKITFVTFPVHKGDPFRLGTTIPLGLSEEEHTLLWSWINSLLPNQPFSTLTTGRADSIMKRVRAGLSAHSIKRGALVDLLRANVPLSVIQTMAKHRDLESLFIYLPRTEVSLALGLHECTQYLTRSH